MFSGGTLTSLLPGLRPRFGRLLGAASFCSKHLLASVGFAPANREVRCYGNNKLHSRLMDLKPVSLPMSLSLLQMAGSVVIVNLNQLPSQGHG